MAMHIYVQFWVHIGYSFFLEKKIEPETRLSQGIVFDGIEFVLLLEMTAI